MNVFAIESILAIGVVGYIAYEIMKPSKPKPLTQTDILIPGVSAAGTPALSGAQTLLAPALAELGAITIQQSGNSQGATLAYPPIEAFQPGFEGQLLSAAWPFHDPVTGRPIPGPISLAGGAPLPGTPRSGGKPQQAVNGTITSGITTRVRGGLEYPSFARS